LYGAINYLNKPGVNILTAEDPIEYTLSGISQVQVREDIGLTFSSALRSFLRQDPEIILVGEIRDTETADIATKAALTGHLVLSTLHTNSAIGAINRLINMGLPPYLVSSALSLVVAQRLIRVNCIHCCEDIELDLSAHKELLKVFSGSRKIKAKQGKGCAECSHTGYFGRKAVHEVLSITPQLQQAISEQKNENELLDIAEKQGYQTMSGVASRFIESGELSPEEYLRVIPRSEEILGED
jgi:type IV pilus assembly protein PilB